MYFHNFSYSGWLGFHQKNTVLQSMHSNNNWLIEVTIGSTKIVWNTQQLLFQFISDEVLTHDFSKSEKQSHAGSTSKHYNRDYPHSATGLCSQNKHSTQDNQLCKSTVFQDQQKLTTSSQSILFKEHRKKTFLSQPSLQVRRKITLCKGWHLALNSNFYHPTLLHSVFPTKLSNYFVLYMVSQLCYPFSMKHKILLSQQTKCSHKISKTLKCRKISGCLSTYLFFS